MPADPLAVVCPVCHQGPGSACTIWFAQRAATVHRAREEAAGKQAARAARAERVVPRGAELADAVAALVTWWATEETQYMLHLPVELQEALNALARAAGREVPQ